MSVNVQVTREKDVLAILFMLVTLILLIFSFIGINDYSDIDQWLLGAVVAIGTLYAAAPQPKGSTTLNLPQYTVRAVIILLSIIAILAGTETVMRPLFYASFAVAIGRFANDKTIT